MRMDSSHLQFVHDATMEDCQEEPQRHADNAQLLLHLPCKLACGTEHNHAGQASPPDPDCAQLHTLDLDCALAFTVLVVAALVVSIALVDCCVVCLHAIFVTVSHCCSCLCTLVTIIVTLVILTLSVTLAVVIVTAP
jgi:hypothetical protein